MLDESKTCNYKEFEYRLLLYAYDASRNGFKELSIITVVTDVVVIALYHFFTSFQ